MGGTWVLWILVLLAVLALLAGLWLLVRVRGLSRVVGSFDCAVRTPGSADWVSGVAVYGVDRIDWYRMVSLRPGPAARWRRRELVVDPSRRALPDGNTVEVDCHVHGADFHLALGNEALSGLTSWLEASPPAGHGAA